MNTYLLKEIAFDSNTKIEFSILSTTKVAENSKPIFGIQKLVTDNYLIKTFFKDSEKKQQTDESNPVQKNYFFMIEKVSNNNEELKLNLNVNLNGNYEQNFAPNEYETATEFLFDKSILKISTEDEDSLYMRSIDDKYFPVRFCKEYSFDNEFWYDLITYKKKSITINIPELLKGEKIYFHLLSSWKNILKSNSVKQKLQFSNAALVSEMIENFN